MNAPALRAPAASEPKQITQQAQPQSRLNYRTQLLQRAQPRIPQTAEGLPVGYYRVDLLPTSYLSTEAEIQALRNAFSDLSFEYGYPTMLDGRPFWHKLDFEPSFAYGTFQIYLEQINEGPRELAALARNEEPLMLMNRQQPKSDGSQWTPDEFNAVLYEYSILYAWRPRAKAYDIYKEAAFRHRRLKRQMTLEEEDYEYASQLLGQLKTQVLSQPNFFKEMNPKTASDLLTKLVAIRRVSVGLPAAGPLSQRETPEDSTFEMILRSLGQKASQAAGGNVYEGSSAETNRNLLGDVLKDPVAAEQMQEIIIRVTKTQQHNLNQGGERTGFGHNQGRTFKGRGRTNEIITKDDLVAPYDITGAPGENLDQGNDGTPIIDVPSSGDADDNAK